ncbi:MAG: methionyl aminopeptidase [Frankiaceae bacterium]|jgi:methionyl aminopeptidase|nr:methionyl aminopeptidase [Frankiaceae bacterium]
MIQIKSEAELATMREAGLVTAAALAAVREIVAPGLSTQDLDKVAEDVIRGAGGIPSFVGYHGFPATLCTSVNDEIVHGIPSPGRVLKDGDLVSIDCGAIVDGFHGDSAITVGIGDISAEKAELLRVTEESMWRGFAAARLGGRIGDISHAIESYIRSQPHPSGGDWGIVEEYVGHGIGTELHQDPQVHNVGRPGRGPRIEKGLVLAVEPMVNLGSRFTRQLDDGWTVVTADGSLSAHFEHTFTVTEDGPWVLTAEDGGQSRLSSLLAATG